MSNSEDLIFSGDFNKEQIEKKTKILLVDDSSAFMEVMLKFFVRFPEFLIVDIAFNAEEAISLSKKHTPEVILLDVEMPGKTGLDTIQEIKSSSPEVKVIILTLFDNPRYRELAKNKGADGFVIKNKFVGELIPKIKQALGK